MCTSKITNEQLCGAGKNRITLVLHVDIKLTEASVFLSQRSHVQHYVNICLFAKGMKQHSVS